MQALDQAMWASVGMTIAYACGMFGLVFAWLYYRRRRGESERKGKPNRGE